MTFLLPIHSLIALKGMYTLNKKTTIKIIELASAGSIFCIYVKIPNLAVCKNIHFLFLP
jgi:hypothetical protein